MSTPADPAAFFRAMLGQWETMANQVGGDALKSEAFARAMHGATGATTEAQAATTQMMQRALAAANMPSRAEVEDLSARLARIEAQLDRIERAVTVVPASSDRPKPSRKRTPPEARG